MLTQPKGFLGKAIDGAKAWFAFDTSRFSTARDNPRFIPGRGHIGAEEAIVNQYDRDTQLINAADIIRNTPLGRGIVTCIASDVVGGGIRPSCMTDSQAWNDEAEAWWRRWSRRPEASGTKSMKTVQRLMLMHYIADGGVAIMLRDDGLISVIEIGRFKSPTDGAGGMASGPYETDSGGKVTHWWIDDYDKMSGSLAGKPRKYRAQDIIIFFDNTRASQIMPYSQLAPASMQLRDISEIIKYTMLQAKSQSLAAIHHKRGPSDAPLPSKKLTLTSSSPDGMRKFAEANDMAIIETDGDVRLLSSVTPNPQFEGFCMFTIKMISMSVGLPVEFLMKFFQSSYSASRASLLLAHAKIREWQGDYAFEVMDPLWAWRIGKAIADGELTPPPANGLTRMRWQFPAFNWVDQKDEINSELMTIRAGLQTMEDAANKRGYQLDDLLTERAREIKKAKDIAAKEGIDYRDLIDITIPGGTPANSDSGRGVSNTPTNKEGNE